MTRTRGFGVLGGMVLVVAVSCGGGAGGVVAQATGTWDCTVQFGEDTNEVTVDVYGDGGFTLTAGDGQPADPELPVVYTCTKQ